VTSISQETLPKGWGSINLINF